MQSHRRDFDMIQLGDGGPLNPRIVPDRETDFQPTLLRDNNAASYEAGLAELWGCDHGEDSSPWRKGARPSWPCVSRVFGRWVERAAGGGGEVWVGFVFLARTGREARAPIFFCRRFWRERETYHIGEHDFVRPNSYHNPVPRSSDLFAERVDLKRA
ncbi:MAG: hypothetical protein JWL81_431 [Verrucomicrobiales bacterium]|nr:hypothetical protein [Verrucomicrobiales bacterium]